MQYFFLSNSLSSNLSDEKLKPSVVLKSLWYWYSTSAPNAIPVPFSDLSKMEPGEPSSAIRERVIKARQIQDLRFKDFKGIHCNAQMTERMIHQFAAPDAASMQMLRVAMERLKLSARAYTRILTVARTIADLAGSEKVQSMHIAEAIGYRNLDRGDWAERGI